MSSAEAARPPNDANASRARPRANGCRFWALVSANAISTTGNMLTSLAVPWFVLQTTGSAAKTGLVAFATILPNALSGFFSGAIVDRLGLKRVSVLGDIASGVTVALVPLLYLTVGLPLWLLLALMLVGATLDAPGSAARSGLIPHVAARAAMPLERANSVLQVVPRLAIFARPAHRRRVDRHRRPEPRAVGRRRHVRRLRRAGRLLACRPNRAERRRPAATWTTCAEVYASCATTARCCYWPPSRVANVLLDPIFAVVLPVLINHDYGDATRARAVIGAFGAGTVVGAVAYGICRSAAAAPADRCCHVSS